MSRPSYNWAELQKASVSDQESVVSGATLVDGTHLAPQQLGLMGMEALETVIRYPWTTWQVVSVFIKYILSVTGKTLWQLTTPPPTT